MSCRQSAALSLKVGTDKYCNKRLENETFIVLEMEVHLTL